MMKSSKQLHFRQQVNSSCQNTFFVVFRLRVSAGSEYGYLRSGFPPFKVILADKSGTPLATIATLPEPSPASPAGTVRAKVLYQDDAVQQAAQGNPWPSVLETVTQFSFGYNPEANTDLFDVISFCVANLTMMPSTVVESIGQNTLDPDWFSRSRLRLHEVTAGHCRLAQFFVLLSRLL